MDVFRVYFLLPINLALYFLSLNMLLQRPIFQESFRGYNQLTSHLQNQPPEVPIKKACNFIKNETLTQVFSCEFCEVLKNIPLFKKHL